MAVRVESDVFSCADGGVELGGEARSGEELERRKVRCGGRRCAAGGQCSLTFRSAIEAGAPFCGGLAVIA